MLQDLDLGALGIAPQQLIQPFRFDRARPGWIDGRRAQSGSLEAQYPGPRHQDLGRWTNYRCPEPAAALLIVKMSPRSFWRRQTGVHDWTSALSARWVVNPMFQAGRSEGEHNATSAYPVDSTPYNSW